MSKAMIAMSGGVDSSVAAYLVKAQGDDCIGATMKLLPNKTDDLAGGKKCCSLADVMDAKTVARKLDIPHYTFNFTDEFNEMVVKRFVADYSQGITPNPCIECNRYLKFGKLLHRARELQCDVVVTGHYARIEEGRDGRMLLLKAADRQKDQSYFLYSMTQKMLRSTLFPLGDLPKNDVREIAAGLDLAVAKKHDSQDVCFVQSGRHIDFLSEYAPEACTPGDFISSVGDVLGHHEGIAGYTIGQRRGIGISFSAPRYVTNISAKENSITLGKERELYSTVLKASNINLISVDALQQPVRVAAKIRSTQPEQPAWVEQISLSEICVTFDTPQRAITSGQAVVLYDGNYVLGGGRISGVVTQTGGCCWKQTYKSQN